MDYTNYFKNQVEPLNANYNDAIEKVDAIKNKFVNLKNSFDSASGIEVEQIKIDLTNIIDKLTTLRKTIVDSLCITNDNASSCERCYYKWKNGGTYTDVGVDEQDGHVCGNIYVPDDHEYRDPNLLEIILGIGTARAEGLGSYEFHKATIEEMLNS